MEKNTNESSSWLVTLAIYLLIALAIRYFIFNITAVDGLSMYPNLDDGDKLITQKVSLYYREPERGEIVVIQAPDADKGVFYIKRVVGLAGDTISLEGGDVYINGEKYEEDYLQGVETDPMISGKDSWQVEEGQIFVMGDNRPSSKDSRIFGPVDVDSVIGISEVRILPINKITKL